jgi:hypothetical protein
MIKTPGIKSGIKFSVSILAGLLAANTAFAAVGSFAITQNQPNAVKPSTIIISAKPGDTRAVKLILSNQAAFAQSFRLYGADGTQTRDNTFTVKSENNQMTQVGTWITFKNTAETLAPAEEKLIEATVAIPADTPNGEYKGGIVARNTGMETNPNGVINVLRMYIPLEIRVTNTPEEIPLLPEVGIKNPSAPGINYYFWASIGIFTAGMAYFLVASRKEKQHKKRAAAHEHTKPHE